MRNEWEALHGALVRAVNTLTARRTFKETTKTRRVLQAYASPGTLVEHLHDKAGDRDEKDRIYAALIEMGQDGQRGSDLAVKLLWLGLWPALDAIYGRQKRHFAKEPEALVSELGALFTQQIHRANLSRINRVAATLTRNVEREVREGLKRKWADERRRTDLPDDNRGDDADGSTGDRRAARRSEHLRTRGVSRLGLPPQLTADDDVRALRAVLTEIVGANADLVIAVAICGESQREVGERLGLGHAAARKRYQRAIARIRERFESGR